MMCVYSPLKFSWRCAERLNAAQAEEFKPERMLDGKFEALPVSTLLNAWPTVAHLTCVQSNAWQAFGFGMRACIVSHLSRPLTQPGVC